MKYYLLLFLLFLVGCRTAKHTEVTVQQSELSVQKHVVDSVQSVFTLQDIARDWAVEQVDCLVVDYDVSTDARASPLLQGVKRDAIMDYGVSTDARASPLLQGVKRVAIMKKKTYGQKEQLLSADNEERAVSQSREALQQRTKDASKTKEVVREPLKPLKPPLALWLVLVAAILYGFIRYLPKRK